MSQRSWRLVWALAVLVSIPALFIGLHDDDFVQRLALSREVPLYQRGIWSLYEFQLGGQATERLIQAGYLPWFTDPGLTVRFFRPLSSALLALDVSLFGDAALPAQLHSLLWFFAALGVAFRIHRLLVPERAAFWASLTFAIAGAHGGSTTWIASRHVLVGGTLALLAWWISLERRRPVEPGRAPRSEWPSVALSSLCFALGLGASEAALTVVPLVLGEACFGRRASRREMVRDGAPLVALSVGYLLFYRVFGYGTFDMGSYVSPFEAPGAFALALLERVPLLLAETATALPVFAGMFGAGLRAGLWIAGAVGMTLLSLTVLAARSEQGRRLAWVPPAVVVSLLPLGGTILSGRVLLVPLVASSLLVGHVIAMGLSHDPSPGRRLAHRVAFALVVVLHLGVAPLMRVGLALGTIPVSRLESTLVERSRIDCPVGSRVLVVNASDPAVGMYSGALFSRPGRERFSGWHVLAMAPNDLELRREGEGTFVLGTLGERRTNVFESLYRPAPLRGGERVVIDAMTITVLESSPHGPTRVRFDVHPGHGPSCLVRARGAESVLESFPLVEGAAVRIPHEVGILGI